MRLTWSNEFKTGQVANENQLVDLTAKPEVGFKYDSLVLDSNNSFKMTGEYKYPLTNVELGKCQTFINSFEFPPMMVPMVDDMGIFQGVRPVTELGDLTIPGSLPPDNTSVWIDGDWHRALVIVYAGGEAVKHPAQIHGDIALIFTGLDNVREPEVYENWDFVKEAWYDSRDIDELKYEVALEVRTAFEVKNIKAIGEYTTQYEMATWRIQQDEAFAYRNDNKAATPFLDKLAETRADNITKAELAERITARVNAWKVLGATLLGEQQNLEQKVYACTTLAELDEIRAGL